MSAHQTLQDLDNNDKFIISLKGNEEIPQYKHKESVMAVYSDTCCCHKFEQQLLQQIKTSKLRLQTCKLNRKKLLNHLTHIYRNHHNIGSVKINNSTYLWFYLTNRPARAKDALGIYKFKHQPIISLVTNMRTFNFNQYIQIAEVNKFTTSNLQEEWETTGPDHTWKLISYSYYIKYAKPGDETGFYHINVNVPDAITTGRGINMIQEFLILTAKESSNCTEILPEIYNHLENW
ncbi:uncharacterized protein CIMG_13651 [Coccidioides immitis RS]|uniref:Uncharacterized protein n=1 Tax=Coccidioides immitis (strain RS) TaxID=246410 RepID=J3KAA4_COCIM|nr:uncharacterized protein CIMG_13651 [Coccidioides immitis RS]EAS31934.3 hypothetical protein CIMG_13651 [Coccidioides immitis RS]